MNDVEILQCPGCKEYIASDAASCRFCRRPLDAQTIKAAVAATQKDNKAYRRKHYLKHMLTGFGLFVAGTLLSGLSLWAAIASKTGGHYVVTWGLAVAGAGNFLYGLFGFLGEALSKK